MLVDCMAMAALVAVVVDVVVAGAISGETGSIEEEDRVEEEVVARTGSGSMSTGSRCC